MDIHKLTKNLIKTRNTEKLNKKLYMSSINNYFKHINTCSNSVTLNVQLSGDKLHKFTIYLYYLYL